ncbi:thioesterase domain-containing protein [Paractinoplanes rishiriensis]|uniref:Thioesterase TesA-like domain-containing protein n=1 Tax=Paractinoplanes rishiriensis TaxID=1050105 RepID=A0A919MY00_9ACTN|nr:thioesterase domain-containing protein [Actinoplanes rishiriensis]GIE99533.1 hypothetical protein Ari01nite_69980 [Actinoplanes rishiriensis]
MTGPPLSDRRRELLARMRAAAPQPVRRAVSVPIKADGDRPPLFLVPPVSGSPYPYLPLRSLMSPQQPVESFEARGLSTDDEPLTDLPAIAADHLGTLRRRCPAGPYLIGGWSFGATVAFEMAHQLTAAGAVVDRLILIDGAVPGPFPEPTEDEIAAAFAADLAGYRLAPQDVADRAGGRRYAVFRANMRAHRSYRPRPWTGRVTVVRGTGSAEPWRGWLDLTPQAVVIEVPGDHYSMWQPHDVPALAAALDTVAASRD